MAPRYRTVGFDFAAEMSHSLESLAQQPGSEGGSAALPATQLSPVGGLLERPDGNNVSMDREGTEMQNQDPTADTDPNEYIDQLVQVNSLEQLIQINSDLGGGSSTTGTSGSGASTSAVTGTGRAQTGGAPAVAAGNLSAPAVSSSATRVASALGTAAQTLAPDASSSPLNSVLSSLKSRLQAAQTSTSNPAH